MRYGVKRDDDTDLCIKPKYTPPTRRNCRAESRRRRRCEHNSQLAHDDCRRIRLTIWKLTKRLHSSLTTWISIDIDNFFNNDVIKSSLVTNLNSSTAQKIVNWVKTADGCIHTTNTTQLDFAVGKFVQTRRDCRLLVANCVHFRLWSPTRLNSTVESRRLRRCVLG